MTLSKNPRFWILSGVLVAVILSFVLNDSFAKTISHYLSIRKTERQMVEISSETDALRHRIASLNDPASYEELVRKDLGYLHPGEKEVRFVKKNFL